MDALAELAPALKYNLTIWSITRGFKHSKGSNLKGGDVKQPDKAIDYAIKDSGPETRGLFVLADFHPYVKDSQIIRKLREAAQDLRQSKKSIIFLGPIVQVPPELEKDMIVLDWGLPDRMEITNLIQAIKVPDKCHLDTTQIPAIVDACLGLTRPEIELSLSRCFVETQTLDVRTILSLKKEIIRKSGILEFYEADTSMADVGGMPALKTWMQKRKRAFTPEARAFGLPQPKGALLIGIPGCGKSLTAKAVGAAWQLPLLRLDVGKIFGGLVGASEENMRKAIKAAEAIAPCILWLDEMEKGFSGVSGSGQSDGGTTARVFASFLTWMQEKTSPVFVIATANDVRALPPELMRKGRFDEIFFVDLPNGEQREEIIKIHLSKRGKSLDGEGLQDLVEATNGFSGAELEQLIIAALFDAFDSDSALTWDSLLQSAKDLTPLSVTMGDQINALRDWADSRARKA